MFSQIQLTAANIALISAIVSVVLSHLFRIYFDNRARKIQVHDRTVDFLESSGKSLNKVFPLLFYSIRKGEPEPDRLKELDDAIFSLFQERNSVKMRAIVYFRDRDSYSLQYDQLCFGVLKVFDYIEMFGDVKSKFYNKSAVDAGLIGLMDQIKVDISQLEMDWYFDEGSFREVSNMVHKKGLEDEVLEVLYHFADLLWMRAIWLQVDKLQEVIDNGWVRNFKRIFNYFSEMCGVFFKFFLCYAYD